LAYFFPWSETLTEPYIPKTETACQSPFRQEPPAGADWKYAELEPLVSFINQAIGEGRFKPDPLIPVQISPCRQTYQRLLEML